MTSQDSQRLSPADLPIPLTRFIGREREVEELSQLLLGARILTLTGAGGSGKTRLAIATTQHIADRYTRVTWVDLSTVSEPGLVANQVASAMRIPERTDTLPAQLVAKSIDNDAALLILDNCEHLVDACADFAEALLRSCGSLTIVATSREALGVTGEMAWLVPPLASDEAVRLFVERAQASQPSFALTPANSEAVHLICRRLDGIPLAIELAAARVRVLSPDQIAQRLGDAFRLLTAGSRTALPRHRTLRATMEWSFALLGAREQVLLRRLAVFAGSFSLEAAEAICSGEPLETEDILDGVTALVDKSLVVMEPGDDRARYRLLETVRQYGLERLVEAGEENAVRMRHALHFLAIVDEVAPNIVGGANAPGLVSRLAVDMENLRAATTWCVADVARAELATRFVGGLFWFWYAMGQFREGRQQLDRALLLEGEVEPLFRGRALLASALTALAQGEYPRSCNDFESALPLLRAAGDQAGTAVALAKLGAAQMLGGNIELAVPTLDTALAYTSEMPTYDIGVIFARFWRGWASYALGELEVANELVTTNMHVGREHALPTTLAHSLVTLARIELAKDNIEKACQYVMEGLELENAINDAWGVGLALDVVAIAAARRGRPGIATQILAAVAAHRERLSVALPGLVPAEREALLVQLREQLGAERFNERYAEGQKLSTPEIVAVALGEAARHTTEHRVQAIEEVIAPPPSVQPKLRVMALGPLQVFAGDKLVESSAWGSARSRELLVYLLMHPEGRTKEQAGLAFWPEASSVQLRNSFHVTLHRLRKALGRGEWIVLDGDRYRVDSGVVENFDVASFEREFSEARRAVQRQQEDALAKLEKALAIFRGDFLDGEPAGDWHLDHRERLQRMYLTGLMELGERQVRDERYEKAADSYRRILARDEFHEEAMLALLRCHAAMGERSQALRAYRRYAERLRQELEADPGRDISRFAERLQEGAHV